MAEYVSTERGRELKFEEPVVIQVIPEEEEKKVDKEEEKINNSSPEIKLVEVIQENNPPDAPVVEENVSNIESTDFDEPEVERETLLPGKLEIMNQRLLF